MFLAFLLCASTASFAQSSKVNAWRTLGMMKYEKEFTSKGGASTTAVAGNGKFIGMIEKLEGEVITLKGYVIPLSGKKAQSHFMFSAFPYRSCFFCGKAGPESVVEVFTKDNQKIPFSEKSMTIKGRFEFTSRNTDGVMFSLKEAELVDR
ncbi:MAG: hypothetical protein AAF990_07470 [Bacteroidota bacterium]